MTKMKLLLNLFFIIALLMLLKSCYYDIEDELYPYNAPDSVTYTGNIVPILQTNCNSCHSGTGFPSGNGIILDTYPGVKAKVDDGKFACAVNHDGSCSPMPKGTSKLSANLLSEINTWLAEGAPNN